eukprot:tig00021612_g22885.t1
MSAKRQATSQLSKDRPEEDENGDEQEITNDFQRADGDTLAKRKIVKVRRPARPEGTGSASSAFAAAFSSLPAAPAEAPKPAAENAATAAARTSTGSTAGGASDAASTKEGGTPVKTSGAAPAEAAKEAPVNTSTESSSETKPAMDASKPAGFVFGSSAAGGFSFSFANPPGGPSTGSFSWSAPSTFNFGAAGSGATSKKKDDDEEGGDDGADGNPEEEVKHDFTVKDPPKMADTPQQTGEEDETVAFQLRRAKLFVLEKESKQFRETGVGPVRVNVHKTSTRSRVIMRVEGSGRLILNAPIFEKMIVDKVTDKQVRVQTVVAGEDGSPTPATYLIRVASKTDAEDLIAKILEIRDKATPVGL